MLSEYTISVEVLGATLLTLLVVGGAVWLQKRWLTRMRLSWAWRSFLRPYEQLTYQAAKEVKWDEREKPIYYNVWLVVLRFMVGADADEFPEFVAEVIEINRRVGGKFDVVININLKTQSGGGSIRAIG